MFRCSVLLCLSVILYSTRASPYKTWGDEKHKAAQDTRSHDFNEKIILGLKEVEPVEQQDLEEINIDPHMAIWKAMKQFRQQKYNKPEEDKDKFYHPSKVQHLPGSEQVGAFHETQSYIQGQLYQEAEKDLDDVHHNIQGLVNYADLSEKVPDKTEVVGLHKASVYMTPEEDKDGLYHGVLTDQVFHVPVIRGDLSKKVYTEPEEDKDQIFHS
ncbi:uncharacterized protein si:ch211-217g15.3 [Clarias gariepinus]|uniref:uncharacterized protein si:ch211-217g15.3 n=1 Tax=Clarias gariepinus TaxID=13013 RepID=UPI00234D4DE3|nr:uncharacterized protein si:ch211-217g15.3 [Clarias gariepinus]